MEAAFWVSRRRIFVRQSSPRANVAETRGDGQGLGSDLQGKEGCKREDTLMLKWQVKLTGGKNEAGLIVK